MAMAWPRCTLHQVMSILLSLCRLRSSELPATTLVESSRGGSPQGHKAGPGAATLTLTSRVQNHVSRGQREAECPFKRGVRRVAVETCRALTRRTLFNRVEPRVALSPRRGLR